MAEELAQHSGVKPTDARVERLKVLSTERVSSSMMRVTVVAADAGDFRFQPLGFDQWARVFLPVDGAEAADVELPHGESEGWYSRWLSMDEAIRPHIRNYTIRDARLEAHGWELDLDFVVHRSPVTGNVEGVGANWALNAQPGAPLGMLDQGALYESGDTTGPILILADESGLPGVEAILRTLPADTSATLVLEVPHADDKRQLPTPANVTVSWLVRDDTGPESLAGQAILAHLPTVPLDPDGYVYAVGEASFVLAARKHALAAGLPKPSVDFCAYWRPARRAKAAAAA